MPKVSVIIPVYGVEKYIERCARSLFEQTLDDIEYLFIDDCTPDYSVDVLRNVLEEYPNRKSQVVIHRMNQNSGQAKVREWGILNASGEYVIHCDSDDWVDTDMYQAMYDRAKAEDADMVVCDYYESDGIEQHNHISIKLSSREQYIRGCICHKNSLAVWNKLIRRSLYEGAIYPQGSMGEDMVYSTQALMASKKIVAIDKPLYYYFFNPSSIVNTVEVERVHKKFLEAVDNAQLVEQVLRKNVGTKYQFELNTLKFYQRDIIFYYRKDERMKQLWRNTFPEINKYVFFLKTVPLSSKIRFYFGLINIIR